jgi:hypothetical protein
VLRFALMSWASAPTERIVCLCMYVCVCARMCRSVVVCAVLKDGVYFTQEGPHGLKALSRRLKEVEALYESAQVRRVLLRMLCACLACSAVPTCLPRASMTVASCGRLTLVRAEGPHRQGSGGGALLPHGAGDGCNPHFRVGCVQQVRWCAVTCRAVVRSGCSHCDATAGW